MLCHKDDKEKLYLMKQLLFHPEQFLPLSNGIFDSWKGSQENILQQLNLYSCNSYCSSWCVIEFIFLHELVLTRWNDRGLCYRFHFIVLSSISFQIPLQVLMIRFSNLNSSCKQWTINNFQIDIWIIR